MTIRAFMVWPDSQIKASKGPAVSMFCCWMIWAFHRLGKTLCRTWQTGLFPVQYAEQTPSVNWAQPPKMARGAPNFMCLSEYWATLSPNLLNKLPLREELALAASARPVQKALPTLGAGGSWKQSCSKKRLRFLHLINPQPGAQVYKPTVCVDSI